MIFRDYYDIVIQFFFTLERHVTTPIWYEYDSLSVPWYISKYHGITIWSLYYVGLAVFHFLSLIEWLADNHYEWNSRQ